MSNGSSCLPWQRASATISIAKRRGSVCPVDSVEVEASAEFPGVGLAATNIAFRAKVSSSASAEEVSELLRVTDAVAEIHNPIRSGAPVTLERPESGRLQPGRTRGAA
jgi:hypothetical protein